MVQENLLWNISLWKLNQKFVSQINGNCESDRSSYLLASRKTNNESCTIFNNIIPNHVLKGCPLTF